MYIGLTPEHDAAARRAAGLLRQAAHARGRGRARRPARASARSRRKIWKQMAADGWLGIGWPKEYGGQGRTAIEQFIFFDESMRAGAPVPMLTINSVAPTIMQYGIAGAEGLLPAEDPGRRDPLRHRLHRARRRHRPRVAQDPGRARRRRVRHQRPEDLHRLATDADYIWLAVRTDPNVKKHKGISMIIVPTDTPGFKSEPIKNFGEPQHELHVLRGRAGAGRQPRRRGEPGLEPHHQPAQPRAGHALLRAA